MSLHQAGTSAWGTTYTIIRDDPNPFAIKVMMRHPAANENLHNDEEDRDCVILHAMVDYDHVLDYPRGRSINYTGRRAGSYPDISMEAARTRLLLVDESSLPVIQFQRSIVRETARALQAPEFEDPATDTEDGVLPEGVLYRAFRADVKAELEKYDFKSPEDDKERHPGRWLAMLVDFLLRNTTLNDRQRRILLQGTVDWKKANPTHAMDYEDPWEHYPPFWTPSQREASTGLRVTPPATVTRHWDDIEWMQEKRFLWHALDTLFVGIYEESLNDFLCLHVVKRTLSTSFDYCKLVHKDGLVNPFQDDTTVFCAIKDNRYKPKRD